MHPLGPYQCTCNAKTQEAVEECYRPYPEAGSALPSVEPLSSRCETAHQEIHNMRARVIELEDAVARLQNFTGISVPGKAKGLY